MATNTSTSFFLSSCYKNLSNGRDYSVCVLELARIFPRRSVRVGFDRKALKIDEIGSSTPSRKIFGYFWCLWVEFLFFPLGNGQKSPKESTDFSIRNTASDFHQRCRNLFFFLWVGSNQTLNFFPTHGWVGWVELFEPNPSGEPSG
jgi:hypothetical protein